MTANHSSDDDRTDSEYDPIADHYCDGDIEYETETLTVSLDSDDWTQTLTGTCSVCGRDLQVVVDVDVTMRRTVDADTGDVLHDY